MNSVNLPLSRPAFESSPQNPVLRRWSDDKRAVPAPPLGSGTSNQSSVFPTECRMVGRHVGAVGTCDASDLRRCGGIGTQESWKEATTGAASTACSHPHEGIGKCY